MASSNLTQVQDNQQPAPLDMPAGAMLTGTSIIPASMGCQYMPAVQADDLLRVNFDRRTVTADGLYLIEGLGAQGVTWRGCRRFRIQPSGVQFDNSGAGEWMPVPPDANMRIAGFVEQVYRPVR